jgi:hypothetical protein
MVLAPVLGRRRRNEVERSETRFACEAQTPRVGNARWLIGSQATSAERDHLVKIASIPPCLFGTGVSKTITHRAEIGLRASRFDTSRLSPVSTK